MIGSTSSRWHRERAHAFAAIAVMRRHDDGALAWLFDFEREEQPGYAPRWRLLAALGRVLAARDDATMLRAADWLCRVRPRARDAELALRRMRLGEAPADPRDEVRDDLLAVVNKARARGISGAKILVAMELVHEALDAALTDEEALELPRVVIADLRLQMARRDGERFLRDFDALIARAEAARAEARGGFPKVRVLDESAVVTSPDVASVEAFSEAASENRSAAR